MIVYLDAAFLLNFIIDFLLLMGSNRICAHPLCVGRCALAAVIGSLYATFCMLPSCQFLRSLFLRIVSLCVISAVAFGISLGSLRRTGVFFLLCMAICGVASGFNARGATTILLSMVIVLALCMLCLRGDLRAMQLIPVELSYNERSVRIMALQDTGNTLHDPVTGRSVLIVDAETAQELTGLTAEQLKNPVAAIRERPVHGLRLIPYRTIDRNDGFLLALRFKGAKIGKRMENILVAFSPEKLSGDGTYQALTGGIA